MNTTILVENPEAFGGMLMYRCNSRGVPKRFRSVTSADELCDYLKGLPKSRRVIVCGRHFADIAAQIIGYHADIYVVPGPWYQQIHKDEPGDRAFVASRLVAAHVRAPIQIYNRQYNDDFPF